MRILEENWEESWVNLCKFFLTYPNSVLVSISFVFILWIINEFKIIFEKPVLRFNRFKIGRFSGFYFKQNRPSLLGSTNYFNFNRCMWHSEKVEKIIIFAITSFDKYEPTFTCNIVHV